MDPEEHEKMRDEMRGENIAARLEAGQIPTDGEWEGGLFDVCAEPGECIMATLPCTFPCFICQFIEKVAPFELAHCIDINHGMATLFGIFMLITWVAGAGTPIFLSIFVFLIAEAAKDKYRIEEGILCTIVKSWFCPCCYMLQIYHHADDIEEKYGID